MRKFTQTIPLFSLISLASIAMDSPSLTLNDYKVFFEHQNKNAFHAIENAAIQTENKIAIDFLQSYFSCQWDTEKAELENLIQDIGHIGSTEITVEQFSSRVVNHQNKNNLIMMLNYIFDPKYNVDLNYTAQKSMVDIFSEDHKNIDKLFSRLKSRLDGQAQNTVIDLNSILPGKLDSTDVKTTLLNMNTLTIQGDNQCCCHCCLF